MAAPIGSGGGPSIVVIGLNPALQKTLTFKPPRGLASGFVNRAATAATGIGGKGQNVCVALRRLKPEASPPAVVQFSGGYAGEELNRKLEGAGVRRISQDTAVEMRTCSSLVDTLTSMTTEIIEPWGGSIAQEEQEALLSQVEAFASAPATGPSVGAVAVMGSAPAGVEVDLPAKALQALVEGSSKSGKGAVKVLVDSVFGVPQLMDTGLVGLLKVNGEEALRLRGLEEDTVVTWMEDSLREAAACLFDRWETLPFLAVTNGALPSYLFSREGKRDSSGMLCFWRLTPPPVQDALNPIGAGDAVAAATLSHWLDSDDDDHDAGSSSSSSSTTMRPDHPLAMAFACGLAAGGAACSNTDPLSNSCFDLCTYRKLREAVRVDLVDLEEERAQAKARVAAKAKEREEEEPAAAAAVAPEK